jgi:anti-anti-sigma factor
MSDPNGSQPQLRINEQIDHDAALRLALAGELDLAVIRVLDDCLVALKQEGRRVRLDLSGLELIDSTGVRELLLAVADAGRDGWDLEIDPHVSETVSRVIELTGAGCQFWPENRLALPRRGTRYESYAPAGSSRTPASTRAPRR